MTTTSDGADRSIKAEGLRRTFGKLDAVDGVDLDVPGGQIFGFLGPNGAGKSTLVKILTTILNPTAGSATVAGYDVQRQGGKVREAIGVALQDVGLDPLMTARELLVLQSELFGTPRDEARKTGGAPARDRRPRRRRPQEAVRRVLRRHEAPARPGAGARP